MNFNTIGLQGNPPPPDFTDPEEAYQEWLASLPPRKLGQLLKECPFSLPWDQDTWLFELWDRQQAELRRSDESDAAFNRWEDSQLDQ